MHCFHGQVAQLGLFFFDVQNVRIHVHIRQSEWVYGGETIKQLFRTIELCHNGQLAPNVFRTETNHTFEIVVREGSLREYVIAVDEHVTKLFVHGQTLVVALQFQTGVRKEQVLGPVFGQRQFVHLFAVLTECCKCVPSRPVPGIARD